MDRIFIASTGQNVGKTTCCLGLFSGLKKRFPRVGFIKPLGQEWVEAESGLRVDKDILLIRHHFQLDIPHPQMSPVLLPSGFTRDFLDEKIDAEILGEKIEEAFKKMTSNYPHVLIEGTGHMGVGSLIDLNNAQVAKRLKAPMVLVAPGGVGSSFDQIALNKALCDQNGVNLIGVILNKIKPDKLEMVKGYMTKALKRWNLPLLGCIPFDPLLSTPTLFDFERLFQTNLIAGEEMRLFHFENVRLIVTAVDVFEKTIHSDQLLITHAGREDIILAILAKYIETRGAEKPLKLALILTGHRPRPPIIEQIKQSQLPCLFSLKDSFTTMSKISTHTAKIGLEDREKIQEAIQVVEANIDFETLIQKV